MKDTIPPFKFTSLDLTNGYETDILYEDELLLLANKPSGLPVHETKDHRRPDFTRLLQKKLNMTHLRTVNRLDVGTSGIVLFGKDPERNAEIDILLSNAEKEYLFIASGKPDWASTRFECFLKDGNKKVTIVRSGGKKAITEFTMLHRFKDKNIFLGKAKLITGRRHQIRISIATLGFPILGDNVYGETRENLSNLFLHSYQMILTREGIEKQTIVCNPPRKFYDMIPDLDDYKY